MTSLWIHLKRESRKIPFTHIINLSQRTVPKICTKHSIHARISNYININQLDAITHSCRNLDGDLAILSLKSGHGWVLVCHRKSRTWLCIVALIVSYDIPASIARGILNESPTWHITPMLVQRCRISMSLYKNCLARWSTVPYLLTYECTGVCITLEAINQTGVSSTRNHWTTSNRITVVHVSHCLCHIKLLWVYHVQSCKQRGI